MIINSRPALLPIACGLDSVGGRERVRQWQELASYHLDTTRKRTHSCCASATMPVCTANCECWPPRSETAAHSWFSGLLWGWPRRYAHHCRPRIRHRRGGGA
jgi:hypothetical protein